MTVIAHILFFAATLAVFTINFIHYMHMFQLNSYSAHEHFEWHKKNGREYLIRVCFPVIFAFIALYAGIGNCFGGDEIVWT